MSSSTDRIERSVTIKAPRSRVWRALSNAEEFGSWFGVTLEGKSFAAGKRVQGQITYPGYEHVVWDVVIERVRARAIVVVALASGGGRAFGRLLEGADDARRVRVEGSGWWHVADGRRVRFRQGARIAPVGRVPFEQWRLGRADVEHRKACRRQVTHGRSPGGAGEHRRHSKVWRSGNRRRSSRRWATRRACD